MPSLSLSNSSFWHSSTLTPGLQNLVSTFQPFLHIFSLSIPLCWVLGEFFTLIVKNNNLLFTVCILLFNQPVDF